MCTVKFPLCFPLRKNNSFVWAKVSKTSHVWVGQWKCWQQRMFLSLSGRCCKTGVLRWRNIQQGCDFRSSPFFAFFTSTFIWIRSIHDKLGLSPLARQHASSHGHHCQGCCKEVWFRGASSPNLHPRPSFQWLLPILKTKNELQGRKLHSDEELQVAVYEHFADKTAHYFSKSIKMLIWRCNKYKETVLCWKMTP